MGTQLLYGQCRSRIGKADAIIHIFTIGASHSKGPIEGIAGTSGIHGLHLKARHIINLTLFGIGHTLATQGHDNLALITPQDIGLALPGKEDGSLVLIGR